MGIFEKSIPKYIVDPIDQRVVVRPEDVYVDDIFDPIFNARVKDAMRQKYGGGLYGVVGGYEELLKNTWTGREGIFGPGMGLLSTFGRSMEKADDIVLGALTEGIKGLSGQGAVNPIENIFVNDVDYTGRELLAATTNIASPLMGGTRVDESDFGSAWTIPALGLELGTDVGILGGTLSRKLAPGASKLTSKQLFENLGKSDLKTSVGEIGQLMSNYDDLMTKVALDVSAPGLRPAFKLLKNRLAAAFATHAPDAYAEVVKILNVVEDESADPAVRRDAQKQLIENDTAQQLTTLFKEPDAKLAATPDMYGDILEGGAEEPTIDRIAAAMSLDLETMNADVTNAQKLRMLQLKENIDKSHTAYNEELYKAFDESRKIAERLEWNTDSSKLIGVTDPAKVQTDALAAMEVVSNILDDLNDEYSGPIREMLEDAYSGNPSRFIDALVSREWSDNIATNSQIVRAIEPRLAYLKSTSPYRVSPSLKSAVHRAGNDGVEYSSKAFRGLNRVAGTDTARFKNIQELKQMLEHPEFEAALEEFIPAQKLSKKASEGLSPNDIYAKEQAIARSRRRKFTNLITAVYFPKKGISTFDYTKKLIELETFVSRYAKPDNLSDRTRFLKNLTIEEVADIKANPEQLLSLRQFLTNKGLTLADEYNRTTDGAAARYLLTGKMSKPMVKNYSLQRAVLSRAKKLQKEYAAELQNMLAELDRVRSTSRNASSFLDKIYSTVDDISQNYLQKLRDEVPHPLKSVVSDVSLDMPVGDGKSTLADILEATADSVPYAVRDSFKPPETDSYKASRAISNYIRATVPDNASVEDFVEFTRPLAPYLDIGYRDGAPIPKSAKSDAIISKFYTEILPLIEITAKDPAWGNTYLNRIFSKDASKDTFKNVPDDVREAILKLRDFFGAPLAKDADPDARVYRQLYRKAVPSISEFGKFTPKHVGANVDVLSNFLKVPRLPGEISTALADMDVRTFAKLQGRDSTKLLDNRINAMLVDLNTSKGELNTIFEAVRKNGVASLSQPSLRKYRAYIQRMSELLRDTPYDVYVRNATDWTSEGNWIGVLDALRSASNVLTDEESERIVKLISRERSQMSKIGSVKYPFRYSADDKILVDKLRAFMPKDIVDHWNPSHKQGLFKFEVPMDNFSYSLKLGDDVDLRPERYQVLQFLKESQGKNIKLTDFKYIDYSLLYSKSGRETLTDLATRERLRMDYIPDTDAVFKDTAIQLSNPMLSTKESAERVADIPKAILTAPPEEVAKVTYEVPSVAEESIDNVMEEVLGEEAAQYIRDGGSGDPETFKALHGKHHWSLFEQIAKAMAVSSKNSFRKNRATLRQKPVKAVLERAFKLRGDHLMNGGKMSDFRRFVALRQQPYGDIVQGKDFWDELRHSGMLGAVYAKGNANADAVFDSLTKNANIINELVKHPIVKVVREDIPNDKQKIYLQFVKNKKGVVWINDAAEKLEKAAFETVTFSPPKAWTAEDLAFMNSDTMRELSAIMDEVQVLAADQAKYLGFAFDTSSQYTKHAMRRNPDTAQWFSDTFYTDFSSEDLDEFVNSISNLERYRKADHGAFGTTVNTRRFRGDVWMMDDGNKVRFNYDPYEMVTSTLADGTFANLQFQSYVDLFMNDNFKIKGWFNTIDDLKEVLYKPLEGGGTSGNLRNLELCTMKLDANGKIIGLTKYDKLSDAGLQKALADENCILVPTNAVSHMDNLLKKDIRMSNKFWTFVNKHFTIPFKFGVLSNPGFLLGNMSDSYLKLATTMSQKYGTTVQEEAQRVAGCIQRAGKYREDYGTAFEVWRKVSKDNGIKLSPEATVPGIVSMSPKYNEQFLEWLDGRLQVEKTLQDPVTGKIETKLVPVPCDLSDNVKNAASTWVMLQSAQMNSDKLREFASLAELANTSEFEMPTNIWDRVLQGKGKYDKHKPSTWGLFMNNPAMSAMLKASGGWEDVIRTASILDDLEHGYTLEELGVLSRGQKFTDADINFRVKLDEAKNTMYNAQFDYERGSDFMEGVGKAVPFPVFFLKNFAYWMELFSENPQYVDNAIDIQEGLWGNRDEENSKDEFAVQAKGRGAIPIGGDTLPKWFKGIYKPSPLQSMFGAFSLLNSPVQDLQYRVNPLISGGAAALAKEFPNDLTTSLMPQEETKYRPYSTNMYERNVKASDPNFNPLEYAVHRANPYERMVNTYLRTPEKIKRGEAQLSDFVPSVFQPDF